MIVLAAIETDACARPILMTATALANLFDATVVALHARENGTRGPWELARAFGAPLREVSGPAVEEIIAAAGQPDVVALAIGARGLHGGPQPAGHTALEVITRVRKPVAVVPPHAQPRQKITRIVVPLEGTSESSQALEDTIRLAYRRRLEVVVLHVHSLATVPAFADHEPHATAVWEREFLSRYIASPHDRVSLQHWLGYPADDIVAGAHENSADLIVLAWSQDLGPGRARVVSQTLARSTIPMLLIPATRARSLPTSSPAETRRSCMSARSTRRSAGSTRRATAGSAASQAASVARRSAALSRRAARRPTAPSQA
jgi:nucleotide-binding universal stress UspA family protein